MIVENAVSYLLLVVLSSIRMMCIHSYAVGVQSESSGGSVCSLVVSVDGDSTRLATKPTT